MPALLTLLQHPSEDRRAMAAEKMYQLSESAPDVGALAVTNPQSIAATGDTLHVLLTRLSSDDSPQGRSDCAGLIAQAAHACDAAALKTISDSGAVPYLLKLLKEATDEFQRAKAVHCLEVGGPMIKTQGIVSDMFVVALQMALLEAEL